MRFIPGLCELRILNFINFMSKLSSSKNRHKNAQVKKNRKLYEIHKIKNLQNGLLQVVFWLAIVCIILLMVSPSVLHGEVDGKVVLEPLLLL